MDTEYCIESSCRGHGEHGGDVMSGAVKRYEQGGHDSGEE